MPVRASLNSPYQESRSVQVQPRAYHVGEIHARVIAARFPSAQNSFVFESRGRRRDRPAGCRPAGNSRRRHRTRQLPTIRSSSLTRRSSSARNHKRLGTGNVASGADVTLQPEERPLGSAHARAGGVVIGAAAEHDLRHNVLRFARKLVKHGQLIGAACASR